MKMATTNVYEEIARLRSLLREAREWVTAKPWDDSTELHKRISVELGLPVEYPDWKIDCGVEEES